MASSKMSLFKELWTFLKVSEKYYLVVFVNILFFFILLIISIEFLQRYRPIFPLYMSCINIQDGLQKMKPDRKFLLDYNWDSSIKKKIKINSDIYGMRRSKYLPKMQKDVLLLLGDSFIFGCGVEDNETLAYHLTKKTLNFGLDIANPSRSGASIGYYTSQIGPLYRKYHPKGIILFYYVGNDIIEIMSDYEKPYSYIKDIDIPRKFARECVDRSEALSIIVRLYTGSQVFEKIPSIRPMQPFLTSSNEISKYNLFRKNWTFSDSSSIQKYKDFFTAFCDSCKEFNLPILMVYIPNKEQVSNNWFEDMIDYTNLDKVEFDLKKPNKVIQKICSESQIEFFDLTDSLNNENKTEYYNLIDSHWNAKGNKRAAELIWNSGWIQSITIN